MNNKKNLENLKKIDNLKELNNIIKLCTNKSENFTSILPKTERIIVIGDLHGDWEATIKLLTLAKVINDKEEWCGNTTVVVQLGDQVDRCRNLPCNNINATKDDEASDLKILIYFTKLHQQAQLVGGAVYSIMGNHELMNVQGDMRYVSYKNIEEFNTNDNNNGMELRKWAFSPSNPLANFLACTRRMVLIIGSNLFVHAGIIPDIVENFGIDQMNTLLMEFLNNKIETQNNNYDLLFNHTKKSPLWTRIFGSSDQSKDSCSKLFKPLKEKYNVDRIFVGHTPKLEIGINSQCDGKLWQVDVGISKAFDAFDLQTLNGKRSITREPQVIEILNDGEKITIIR